MIEAGPGRQLPTEPGWQVQRHAVLDAAASAPAAFVVVAAAVAAVAAAAAAAVCYPVAVAAALVGWAAGLPQQAWVH